MKYHPSVQLAVLMGLVLVSAGAFPRLAEPANNDVEAALAAITAEDWSAATVDTTRDVGRYLAVAVDPRTGAPYVSYYDETGQDLWFARRTGYGGNCGPSNTWACQVVDSSGDVGMYNSIAVKSAGTDVQVFISYYDATNGMLKFAGATCAATCPFDTRTIDTGWRTGLNTSATFDANGVPQVAYQEVLDFDAENLLFAKQVTSGGNCGVGPQSGMWQCDTIVSGEGMGTFTAIAVDGSNRPHVAFYDPTNGYPYHAVRVGTGGNCGTGNSWYCRSPYINTHDTGDSISLFVESNGDPHLAFLDSTTAELVYATYVGSGGNCGFSSGSLQWEWQCDVIDGVVWVGSTSTRRAAMTADPAGYPVIAYRKGDPESVLRVARPYTAVPDMTPNCGPVDLMYTWYCSTEDGGGSYQEEAAAVSVASDDFGMAIAYHELDTYAYPSEGNLKAQVLFFPLFADGFEIGTTGNWSNTVP